MGAQTAECLKIRPFLPRYFTCIVSHNQNFGLNLVSTATNSVSILFSGVFSAAYLGIFSHYFSISWELKQ